MFMNDNELIYFVPISQAHYEISVTACFLRCFSFVTSVFVHAEILCLTAVLSDVLLSWERRKNRLTVYRPEDCMR